MAIFNYAGSVQSALSKGNTKKVVDLVGITSVDAENFSKFFITGDGHIISHGVDFIPWTNSGDKRFLANLYLNVTTETANPVAGTLWASTTTKTYVDDSVSALQKALQDKINTLQSDAMQLKGTISTGTTAGKYSVNSGADQDFPADPSVGDTYRVVKAGTYNGVPCEVGDLIICTTKKSGETAALWTVAQANINGSTSHSINGSSYTVYTTDTNAKFTIYAPTTAGTANLVLVSSGGTAAPVWKTQSISYNTTSDVLTYNLGGISGNFTINGRRAVTVNGSAFLANTVSTALNLKSGSGVNVAGTNGTVTFSVGSSYVTSGRNFAVKVDATSNSLYVNVPETVYNVVTSSANGLAPKVISTNTTLVNNAFYVLASSDGKVTPSWYKLPETAFKDTWRDIKVGTTSIGTATLTLQGSGKTTVVNNAGTVTISSTWRDVQVAGKTVGDLAINFMPTGDIYVKTADQNTTNSNTFDIGFGIAWYNVDTEAYEYA